ncbi:MAG TPA: phosphoketolase family protein [Myxococcaceae bacterium]|nr:phosphoketolase family protein [Myxococcaceae bacterium]
MPDALTPEEVRLIDAWWRAANYLTVGQIYLQDNPLLREPLRSEHIKPRLLGHWGTSPGLSLVYAHLNRLIRRDGFPAIFLAGPGHGGPAVVACTYLEGTYSEIYPRVTPDAVGMRRLFRQFSTPGGIPSHVSAPTPGSIHEGGELGYVLTHAFGAVFDDPELVAIAVVGDGEAETGPLEGSWKGITYLNPARDGAVLPILHLNGYKISSATVLGRSTDAQIRSLLEGHGYQVLFVEGDDPPRVHQALAATLDGCLQRIRRIQKEARSAGVKERPRWPALVLRTPKGWTGPGVVDGVQVGGTFRAHQVPLSGVRDNPEHLRMLEAWMRSYRPAELFDGHGALVPELQALAPRGSMRMSANPRTSGETCQPLKMPSLEPYAVKVEAPATLREESTRRLGLLMRDLYRENPDSFRLFCPDESNSNRLGAVFEASKRAFMLPLEPTDESLGPDGRVMEVLSEHNCEGWLEGYLLTGRHGLFATYEAFAMVVASMATQHAKWLDESLKLEWRKPVPSLNVLLTSTCWRNDHNGFSHQGPGFIDTVLTKKPTVSRIYLPPDANCLLWTAHHCFRHPNHVNLLVIDKQPQLQYLDLEAAHRHCQRGASVWEWASNDEGDPDIVMACAGDVPTMEALAATWLLRTAAPGLRIRVVNVVDLMSMFTPEEHPHGMDEQRFVDLFTRDRHVVFAFHGYPLGIHHTLHGRPNAARFHVRGFREQGTTTTPFDMVVLNGISRYHLAIEALRRARRIPESSPALVQRFKDLLERHRAYVEEHLEDMPEVRDWTWTPP